jgi:putative glycosyltransferase
MMTGLTYARGDLVFLLDSDLEEDPAWLETFYERLRATEAAVVFGVQRKRKGRLFERLSGAIFFKIFNALSTQPIPRNVVTARLMTHKYVAALVQHQERETQIAGLWALTGFKQVSVSISKSSNSTSTYSFRRKVSHLVNAITSFSIKPLVLIFYLGCVILLLSTIAALDLIVRKLMLGTLLEGWASLIVSIWLLGGLTIFCLGVIGIYLAKVFIEVKRRPYTIVQDIYECSPARSDLSREELNSSRT